MSVINQKADPAIMPNTGAFATILKFLDPYIIKRALQRTFPLLAQGGLV